MGWDNVMHELFVVYCGKHIMHKSNIMTASFHEQSSSINRSLGLGVI